MAITTQSAKAKGRKLQQLVRDKILSLFPQLTLHDVRSTSSGSGGEDIQLSPAARSLFPYSVECKAHKSFAIYKIMEQAVSNCPDDATPLSVIKGDRQKPLVVIDADIFFDLLKGRNNG